MSGKLEGRTAVVTGAGSGMGRAIAGIFAREGANVLVLDLEKSRAQDTIATFGPDAGKGLAVMADVTNYEEVSAAVDEALKAFGSIDILVNNAGIADAHAPLLDISDETWQRVMDVNLNGPYVVTKTILPHIIAAGGGTVVNVASVASFVSGCGGAAYTTSKHGILGFTKQLALDYAHSGVRVNAICPGAVNTELSQTFWEQNPEALETWSNVPAQRIANTEDIANLALFLASDDSAFIYGTGVVIDGGWTLT